jgi:hypothetical protein
MGFIYGISMFPKNDESHITCLVASELPYIQLMLMNSNRGFLQFQLIIPFPNKKTTFDVDL